MRWVCNLRYAPVGEVPKVLPNSPHNEQRARVRKIIEHALAPEDECTAPIVFGRHGCPSVAYRGEVHMKHKMIWKPFWLKLGLELGSF